MILSLLYRTTLPLPIRPGGGLDGGFEPRR
jgi:hypothetical protein